jgi:hypothetical protein
LPVFRVFLPRSAVLLVWYLQVTWMVGCAPLMLAVAILSGLTIPIEDLQRSMGEGSRRLN